jgi:hypothetical protein
MFETLIDEEKYWRKLHSEKRHVCIIYIVRAIKSRRLIYIRGCNTNSGWQEMHNILFSPKVSD